MKNIKKVLSLVLTLALVTVFFAGCSKKDEKVLKVYTWNGVFTQRFADDFQKATGIRMEVTPFDTNEVMLSKLMEGEAYDIVIADDYIIESAVKNQLAKELDKSKIENFKNINPLYQGQFYDKEDKYTFPNGAGVMTIAYNPANVTKEITSYSDLWDESLKNKIGVIGNYRVITGTALKIAGESYNTEDVSVIEAAGKKMLELAPNIKLIKDNDMQNDLLTGAIDVGLMYTSQVTQALQADPDLKVVFPTEGIGFGIMAGFIPSKADNETEAYEFINYILDAQVSAKFYEEFGYYTTNKASEPYISERLKSALILPADFDTSKMEMIKLVGEQATQAHEKAWLDFVDATPK